MRFAHTADWHLGRLFHQASLTEDQAYALDGVIDIIRDAKVDAVLIAGDLYDRAVPPQDAVTLLDDVLCRIAIGLRLPVVMIAGNHDSPQRLSFGSRLLELGHVHVFGAASPDVGAVTFHDRYGVVHVHAVPYAEPAVVSQCFGDDEVVCHDSAMRRFVRAIATSRSDGARNVLVAHAFVTGGVDCDSERPLSIGGAGTVDASCFSGFDYVALGHLHEPQTVGDRRVSYAGSLLKYSFSESEHRKSVSIVEVGTGGTSSVERVPIPVRRDVRRIKGLLADLLKGPARGESRDDYIEATIEDEGALLDPISKLRNVYPNVLSLQRPRYSPVTIGAEGRFDFRAVGDDLLFERFFAQVTGTKPTAEQAAYFSEAVSSLRFAEREVAS